MTTLVVAVRTGTPAALVLAALLAGAGQGMSQLGGLVVLTAGREATDRS